MQSTIEMIQNISIIMSYIFNSKNLILSKQLFSLNCGIDHPLSKNYGKKNDLCQYENFLTQNKFFISIKIILIPKIILCQ